MKKVLKVLAVSACALTAAGFTASCSSSSKMKVGLICLHDENSTYDKNFIDAFKKAAKAKGYTAVIKTNIPEDEKCYTAAADLADAGCKFVFADSFSHEDYVIKAAKEFKDVQFSHATGTKAHTENLSNFHNAFASIYEGRYLAGVAAGLKLQAMTEANPETSHKIGYVGAFTYAEVMSGYTSYYLGVRSVVSDVTMEVTFTGSWYDETAEKTAAETLISRGCSIISQHADSMGAPTACENAGVPNISYNGSTEESCPNTFVVSSKIDWQPYFEHAFDATYNNTDFEKDYSSGLGSTIYDGSVCLTALGAKAAASGTEAKLNEVASKLKSGELKVFDLSKFTVNNGETLSDDYEADVDTDAAFTADTKVIKTDENGVKYFAESEFRSAPYFTVEIDGITLLDRNYGD